MSKPCRLFAVVALFAVAGACGVYLYSPATAQEKDKPKENAPAAAVTKWEYRIVVLSSNAEAQAEKELNQLGGEGYEVAFVTGSHQSRSNNARNGAVAEANPVVYYTLKRAKK